MKRIVFYSWQSDLPNTTNRNFIEDALKKASTEIENDDAVDIEPVIDRDTKGMAGAPDIATVIFAKIEAADVFVADVSIVSKPKDGRATPNPNVLIELGYALKACGYEKLILIFNEAYGKLEDLPFDLKMRRVLTYNCPDDKKDHSEIKKHLVKRAKEALVLALENKTLEVRSSISEIIENNPPNKILELRRYLQSTLDDLQKLQPKMFRDGGTVSELQESLPKTLPIVAEFAKLSEAVVLMKDTEALSEIFKWFGKIYEFYNPPANVAGKISDADGDFFKFIGHELFVIFLTPFLKEERWEDLKKILAEKLKSVDRRYSRKVEKVDWSELSDYSPLLYNEGKKNNRKSLHADLLAERHGENSALEKISPLKDFMETDLFLHIYGKETGPEFNSRWYPYSALYMKDSPTFVAESQNYRTAIQVAHTLSLKDTEQLKKRLYQVGTHIFDRGRPYTEDEIDNIATEGKATIIA